jgi:hypothetical protein
MGDQHSSFFFQESARITYLDVFSPHHNLKIKILHFLYDTNMIYLVKTLHGKVTCKCACNLPRELLGCLVFFINNVNQ